MVESRLHPLSRRLGATLYMPVTNPHAGTILEGGNPHGAGSIVICLEDALGAGDVDRGLEILSSALMRRRRREERSDGTLIFVRPRHLEMARRIAAMPGAETLHGIVAPKMTLETGPDWFAIARDSGLPLMPTLETAEMFDPSYVAQMRAMFDAAGRESLVAVRVGGNDLLGALGLRRAPGGISHEGPLSWVLSMISSQMMAHGYAVAAPVFDIIDDLDTLAREVGEDVRRGFVGKTAIHPRQIPVIHAALRVDPSDLAQARAILDASAAAVFRMGGAMCEPATHAAWARRILDRAESWGVGDADRGISIVAA
jgi:citrate lyase beta subunit